MFQSQKRKALSATEEQRDCTGCLELEEIKQENRKLQRLNIKLQQRLMARLEGLLFHKALKPSQKNGVEIIHHQH